MFGVVTAILGLLGVVLMQDVRLKDKEDKKKEPDCSSVLKSMQVYMDKKRGHQVYNMITGGGVWMMFYTTFLYSLLWMQALIGEENEDGTVPDGLQDYQTVEDKFAGTMLMSLIFCILLAPVMGYLNDLAYNPYVDKTNLMVPVAFGAHGIFCTCVFYSGQDVSRGGSIALGFFMVVFTLCAVIAVFTNYTRNLPKDSYGTMLGVLASGSQLMAFFFILICKSVIHKHADPVDAEAPYGSLGPIGIMCYVDFIIAIAGSVIYCMSG